MAATEKYWARRPIPHYAGKPIDRGQVMTLGGYRNDERLIRLGYLQLIEEKNPRLPECGECGEKFVESRFLTAHGRARHRNREPNLDMVAAGAYDPTTGEPTAFVDTTGDAEEARLEREAPLYLDKTEASRR